MFFHKSKNRDKNIDKKALYKNLSLSPLKLLKMWDSR